MKSSRKNLYLIMLIMVISGVFGFIYETIFYKIDLGYFVKRGTTYGPWIPIYAMGGLLIYLCTNKFKDNIFLTFIISMIVCGLLEFIVGYMLYHISGIRLWDYNVEILNFGNISGYICLRSVLFFGISGVFLMKIVLPFIYNLKNKVSEKTFNIISILPSILFLIDFIISDIIKF